MRCRVIFLYFWVFFSIFPWMAAVRTEHRFLCAGTLITKKFVLTGANCINNRESLFVQLGIWNRSDATGGHYMVSRRIKHPDFVQNPGPNSNNIGLLELHAEVKYTDRIRPICILLGEAASVLRNIHTFTAFGWGGKEEGHVSHKQKHIQLRRVPSEECQSIGDRQFCAYTPVNGGICIGDAGGPLVAIAKNRTVQVGIISHGSPYCNDPTTCTDVASYTDWIAANAH